MSKESKQHVRTTFKEYRSAYSDFSWKLLSHKIQRGFLKHMETENPTSVACYIHSNVSREVHTDLIISTCLKQGITVMVPRVVDFESNMELVELTNSTPLRESKWGIMEPDSMVMGTDMLPDVILVPMLGVDRFGYRLGYGKGYYDRFLTGKALTKIGLSPESCIVHQLPVDSFDIPMDYVITECGVLRINKK
jgi:5-formyltetrahydrofolate cyclo-ligase